MYVMTAYKANTASSDAAGTLGIKRDTANNRFYALYKGADTLLRSDMIDVSKVLSYTATPAASIGLKFKKVFISLNADVNSGAPVAAKDYILHVNIRQAFGKSDTNTYSKFGAVRTTSGMTAAQFWTKMKESLEANFSREATNWFTFTVVEADIQNSTPAGLMIAEAEQPWRRGVLPKENVLFDISSDTILVEGSELQAFTVGAPQDHTISGYTNGHIICDQEFFFMGERGDQYRQFNYPKNIDVKYLASPSESYYAVNIHYYSDDSNEGVQKQEKELYIVGPKTAMNSLISALNTATGKSVATFA